MNFRKKSKHPWPPKPPPRPFWNFLLQIFYVNEWQNLSYNTYNLHQFFLLEMTLSTPPFGLFPKKSSIWAKTSIPNWSLLCSDKWPKTKFCLYPPILTYSVSQPNLTWAFFYSDKWPKTKLSSYPPILRHCVSQPNITWAFYIQINGKNEIVLVSPYSEALWERGGGGCPLIYFHTLM